MDVFCTYLEGPGGLFTDLAKTVKQHFSGEWENQKRIWQMIDDCAAYMHFRNQLITNVMLKQVQDNPTYLEEQHTAKWTHISRDMQKFKDMHNAGKDTRATAVWRNCCLALQSSSINFCAGNGICTGNGRHET